jgi:transposase
VRKTQVGVEGMALVGPARSGGERSEPERSGGPTSESAADPASAGAAPDPEVTAKPLRRHHTAEYKVRILREADTCGPGGIAALLRREGLYSSALTEWRRQRELGQLAGLASRKRGRKAAVRNPLIAENERLRRENEHLQKRLRQAETIIEVQKKLCEVLGLPVHTPPESEEKNG